MAVEYHPSNSIFLNGGIGGAKSNGKSNWPNFPVLTRSSNLGYFDYYYAQ